MSSVSMGLHVHLKVQLCSLRSKSIPIDMRISDVIDITREVGMHEVIFTAPYPRITMYLEAALSLEGGCSRPSQGWILEAAVPQVS